MVVKVIQAGRNELVQYNDAQAIALPACVKDKSVILVDVAFQYGYML